jgi:hypothetical protein
VAGSSGELALVQGLAEHGFDYGLAADVEFFGGGFEFFEHGCSEVDVDALNGFHHFAGVGEEAGDVSAVVGLEGDALGGFSSLSSRSPRDRT